MDYTSHVETCVAALTTIVLSSKLSLSLGNRLFNGVSAPVVGPATPKFSKSFDVKRFTATEKWDKTWFQELSLKHKCFWFYLCDRCDNAGIIEANYKHATFIIGTRVDREDLEPFGDRVLRLNSGKLMLRGFIEFQYGKLNDKIRPHAAVLKTLKRELLSSELEAVLNPSVENHATLAGNGSIATDKEKDKDTDKEKDKEEGVQGEPPAPPPVKLSDPLDIPPPLNTSQPFVAAWHRWMTFRRGMGSKPGNWAGLFGEQLMWLATFTPAQATKIVEQSIRNGWKGLFEKGTDEKYSRANNQRVDRNIGTLNEGNHTKYAGLKCPLGEPAGASDAGRPTA